MQKNDEAASVTPDTVVVSNAPRSSQAPAPGRRRTQRLGFLTINGQDKGLPCTLRDYCDDGAIVSVSGWIGIPDTFGLYVEPEGIRHVCKILARKGNAVRVAFES